jgi:uncharacterized membrane protein
MTWLGVLALVIGALFFLQYAARQGWIIPSMRIGMAVLMGVALLVIGGHFLRRQMRALGQGLMGGGLAVLYGAFYAAFAMYDLFPQPVAFAAMVAVSALGLILAVRHNALPISFIAVLGGFITPMILRSGQNQRDLLFTYLIVLDLTVLAVAFFRQWPALLTLSFLGTTALFLAWFGAHYEPSAMTPTLLWLGAFYLAFLLMPFAQHLARRRPLDAEQFAAAHVAAVCAFIMAHRILWPEHEHVLGFIALGMSALYAGLGAFSRLRVPEDRKSLFGFTLLAVSLLTLSVPLHFGLNGITAAWAIEGPVLVALGWLFRYRPLRVGGFIVLGLAVLRVYFYHWPLHAGPFTLFLNRSFAVAMLLPLAAAACAWMRRRRREEASDLDDALALAAVLLAGTMATLLVASEVSLWISLSAPVPPQLAGYWKSSLATAIWTLGAAGFLLLGARLRHDAGRAVTLFMLAIAYYHGLGAYGQLTRHDAAILLNVRCACVAAPVLLLFLYSLLSGRAKRPDAVAAAVIAGCLAPILLIAEVHVWPGWNAWAPHGTPRYWQLSCDTLILACAAAVFAVAGYLRLRPAFRIAAWPLSVMALLLAANAYAEYRPQTTWLFLNLRFSAAVSAVGTLFLFAVIRRRLGAPGVAGIAIAAGLLATLLIDVEVRQWIDRAAMISAPFRDYWQNSADAFVWAVGAAAFLLAGLLGRNAVARAIALPMLAVAGVLACIAYDRAAPDDALLFLNPPFIASAFLLAVAYAAAGVRRRFAEPGAAAVAIITGVLTTLLIDVEIRQWLVRSGLLDQSHRDYWLLSLDSVTWAVSAGVFLALGVFLRSFAGRAAAIPVAGVAFLLWVWGCMVSSPPEFWAFLNTRFLGIALVVIVLGAFAEAHRRLGEAALAVAAGIGAGYLAMIAVDVDMALWIARQPASSWVRTDYHALCAHLLAALAGTTGFLIGGFRKPGNAVLFAGMAPLLIAGAITLALFAHAAPQSAPLFLNARFLLGLGLCAALFLYSASFRRRDEVRDLGNALFWAALPALLLLLSVEDYRYWTERAGLDPRRAGWVAQMSLSLIWGLYAAALLGLGFWRRARALRFCALALFGLTALKLVLIDIAHVHQLYRIISFIALGILMIAASYLYHRIEKRMET